MRSFSGKSSGTRMSVMRIARRLLPYIAFLSVAFVLFSCRSLVREAFKTPKIRVVDVKLDSNPMVDPKGPWAFTLFLAVDNPNDYPLNVAFVAYSAILAKETVADGEHRQEIRIEPSCETTVGIPLSLRPEAFKDVLRQVLRARSLAYEFNGSVGLRTPLTGVIRIPFSHTGKLDPMDLLKKKGIVFN